MTKLVICGAINWDITCFVGHLPVPGEEVTIKRVTPVSGGTGANVAVAAARILGTEQVALIGALGENDIAHQQITSLTAEGVITEGISHISGEESGQAYILVDQAGQNVIASHLGANARLGLEHLTNQSVQHLLQECQSIVLTDPPLAVATELIGLAKNRRIPVLWDPGILTSHGWAALEPIARETDTLFLNEAEATALFGSGETDIVLRRLQESEFPRQMALKLGAKGAVMIEATTGLVVEAPALPLEELGLNVINTVGCGDVFVGAFAAYRTLEASMQEALIMASAAAGINATRAETRGSPDRPTLEAIEQRSRNLGFMAQERKPSKNY